MFYRLSAIFLQCKLQGTVVTESATLLFHTPWRYQQNALSNMPYYKILDVFFRELKKKTRNK